MPSMRSSRSPLRTLECPECGAPVEDARGGTIRCTYCARVLSSEAAAPRGGESSLLDELLRGHAGEDLGVGRRYSVAEMEPRDWRAHEHGIWPASAVASSTWGGKWAPDAVVGGPNVYPRHGDLAGAWAPRQRTGGTEWIEARFTSRAPARAIRVFETSGAGSTFAVTVRTDEDEERVVYRRAPAVLDGAQVLEIELPEPIVVRAVRVVLDNAVSSQWAEVDTIGLLAAAPLPTSERTVVVTARRSVPGCWIIAIGIALVTASLVMCSVVTEDDGPGAALPAPTRAIEGARMTVAPSLVERDVVWASRAPRASSEYQEDGWSRHRATGGPNVYPMHVDNRDAWASGSRDDGEQWIELAYASPVDARAILVVESFNPGALVRVDDLSDGDATTLWRGVTERGASSRVLSLELPTPRRIAAVRLVLDTARVSGWNEIDAVGLVPAR